MYVNVAEAFRAWTFRPGSTATQSSRRRRSSRKGNLYKTADFLQLLKHIYVSLTSRDSCRQRGQNVYLNVGSRSRRFIG